MPADESPSVSSPRGRERTSFLLGQLGNLVVRGMKARMQELDLHPRQSAVLSRLVDNDGQSQQNLAETLTVHRSAMVALIDDLEARGLVARERSEDDRRAHAVTLTPAGRTLEKQIRPLAEGYERDLLEPLNPEERELLHELLARLASHHGIVGGTPE